MVSQHPQQNDKNWDLLFLLDFCQQEKQQNVSVKKKREEYSKPEWHESKRDKDEDNVRKVW
jgi:hypothetical protein